MPDYFPEPHGSGQPNVPIEELVIGGLPFPWQRTIVSQYANSPKLLGLVAPFSAALDGSTLLDNFYNLFWNVQTAVGYGLDVWGRIVGVGRVIEISALRYFGFQEGGDISYDPFNQSPFYSGQPLTAAFRLDDTSFRRLIFAKAASNIWDGSIPQVNAILQMLFPGQVAYIIDNQDMTMTYHFGWILTPVDASIAITSGILPRPSGVKVEYEQSA
jgi:hypothetical protein